MLNLCNCKNLARSARRRTRVTLSLFLCCLCSCLGASSSYYVTDSLQDHANTNSFWTVNGEPPASSAEGLTAVSAVGTSYLTNIPAPTPAYEVAATLTLRRAGGTYVIYLQASKNALLGTQSTGTFYAFVIKDPVFRSNGCSASATLLKSTDSRVSEIQSTLIPCGATVTYQAAVWRNSSLHLSSNDTEYLTWTDSKPLSGTGGVGGYGMPVGNEISLVRIGTSDETAMSEVSAAILSPAVTSKIAPVPAVIIPGSFCAAQCAGNG